MSAKKDRSAPCSSGSMPRSRTISTKSSSSSSKTSDLADLLAAGRTRRNGDSRRTLYFKELLRLQRELMKLQDWVVAQEAEGRRALRGTRRGRQGRRDQAHHPAPQPARLPRRGAARAERARAHAVVFPALRAAPAGGRRDRAVRPQLVQPRRRRARHGLLHRGGIRGFLPLRAGVRDACWCAPASS